MGHFALSLTLALGLFPPQEPTASLEIRAVPLKRALAEVGRAYGVNLSSSGSFAELPILLKFDNVPLSVAKAKIAQASRAEWAEQNGQLVLLRTSAIQTRLQQEERQRTIEKIRTELDKLKASIAEQNAFDSNSAADYVRKSEAFQQQMQTGNVQYDAYSEHQRSGVAGRTLDRLLASLSPEALADARIGEPIVFAINPNRMQRAMPAAATTIARTAVAEQNLIAEAYKNLPNQMHYIDPMRRGFEDGVGRFLVKVSRSNQMGPRLSATLLASNSKDLIVLDASKSLTSSEPMMSEELLFSGNLGDGDYELNLSEPSKVLGATLRSMSAGGMSSYSFPQAAMVHLKKPEVIDPLSITASEIILDIAAKKKTNVAALLPDSIFMTSLFVSAMPKPSAKMFMNLTRDMIGYEFKEDDGWLLGESHYPVSMQEDFAPRNVLSSIVSDLDQNGSVSLDTLCKVALSTSDNDNMNLAVIYVFLLSWETLAGVMPSLDVYRIWGSLSVTERNQLMGNGRVYVRGASPTLAKVIWSHLNSNSIRYQFTPAEESANQGSDRYYRLRYREATELLPEGLRPDTYLEGPIVSVPGVRLSFVGGSESNYEGMLPMTAQSYATYAFQGERPDIFGDHIRQREQPQGFLLGKMLTGPLKIHVSPEGYYGQTFTYFSMPKGTKPVPFASLPAEFREEFERQMKAQRESWGQVRRDGGDG